MTATLGMHQPNRRLALGVAASALLHAAVTASGLPAPAGLVAPAPLTVELRSETSPHAGPAAAPAAPPSQARGADARTDPAPAPSKPAPDRYYKGAELDVRARQLNEVHLVYPKAAYEMRVKGRVVVNLLINELGAVDARSILESEPAGVFDRHALAAVDALEFAPALLGGRAVKSQKKIEVIFDPYESINTP